MTVTETVNRPVGGSFTVEIQFARRFDKLRAGLARFWRQPEP